jgi:polyisoprenyl-phosphate glycosyltransferase
MSRISVVIPVYFNALTLPALWKRLSAVADQMPQHDFEFIFVNDGSTDHSYEVMCNLAEQDSRIQAISLTRNFGSNVAILAGISYATGDAVGFIAADLQDPPEMIPQMVEAWENGTPVVFAVRKDRKGDPFLTRLFANFFNFLFQRLVYKDFSQQGIGFFFIDKKVRDVLLRCEEKNVHLIGLLMWTGFPYQAVYYDRVERSEGKSRWTLRKKLKYFIDAFVAFSYLPLRLTSALGLLFAFIGGLYAIYIVIARLLNDIPVEGWTTLAVMILILSGIQLVMLGVIGEYLWRNFDATRKRPLFVVDRTYQKRIVYEDQAIHRDG